MRNYFYNDNGKQVDPISIEELKEENISKETLVWYEGMAEWKKAIEVEELKELFVVLPPPIPKITPPPIPTHTSSSQVFNNELKQGPTKNNQSRNTALIIVGVVILLVAIIAVAYNNMGNNVSASEKNNSSTPTVTPNNYEPPRQKTPEELKKELLSQERLNPTKYISQSGTWRLNFGNQDVLEGTIYNTATMASFKDVVLEVTWVTKTNTALKTEYFTVYEFIGAGRNKAYKIKTYSPSSTGGAQVRVYSAKAVY